MKPFCRATLTLLLLAAPLAGAEPAAESRPADEPKASRVETYRTIGDTKLDLHFFLPPGHKAADRRPAIVFFFGGGWTKGSPGQFFPQCKYLASRGMVAISADYRIYSRDHSTIADSVSDAQAAIRWVRANAKRLGIDPDRIAAGGGSAGGHLAAATATLKDFTGDNEHAAVSFRPNALVLFNPALDLVGLREGKKAESDQPERLPNRAGAEVKDISPMQHVAKGQPPCIIFHGREDRLIPFKQMEAYARAMKDAGSRCEVVGFDGVGHGFFNVRGGNDKNFRETLRLADQFLVSLGYLPATGAGDTPASAPARTRERNRKR